jgi:hypothetical protein
VLGRRVGERVDRLVVIAYHAELVAVAEPALEQTDLERVHVLELVDGERREARADLFDGLGVLVEQTQREREHVLEVEPAHRALARLVPVVDAVHEVRRDRRLVAVELGHVPRRRDHPVLRPLDLAGELAPRQELVRRRERVRERGDERSLVVQDIGQRFAGVRGPQPRKLRERGRVERACLDPLEAESCEARPKLARSLVRERHGQDPRRLERAAAHLARDPVRDRGGLARPRAGKNDDRSADRETRLALCVVQTGNDVSRSSTAPTVAPRPDGTRQRGRRGRYVGRPTNVR